MIAIILAAGSSRRFGRANKLLTRWHGAPLLLHALRSAMAAPVGRAVVVIGHDALRVRALVGRRATVVHTRDHGEGIAASLRAGLRAMRRHERAAFLFLGDMPAIPCGLPRALAPRLRPGIAAVRPMVRGKPGHPVLIARPSPAMLRALKGDAGLRPLLAGRAVRTIAAGPGALRDVDRRG